MTSRLRHAVAVAVLLGIGVGLMPLLFGRSAPIFVTLGTAGPQGLAILTAIAIAVAAGPARYSTLPMAAARRGIAARPRTAAAAVAVLTVAYLFAAAKGQGRSFRPYVHDEFSYLIQAHQFARLHAWYPAHPLAPAFDGFQLFADPVYASAYFPGTALLHVPGVWLRLPPWATSLALAGVVAGLLFRLVTTLVDGVAAVVAALLLASDIQFRGLSVMTLAQMPLLAAGLSATLATLAWRDTGRRRWAVAIGVAMGLAAVTRPLDAACFAVPIAVAVLARRPRPIVLAWMIAPTVPFLALQLTLNHGITGRWLTTPFRLYADREYPGTAYGFHRPDPAAGPASPLRQARALYDDYRPLIAEHTPAHVVADQLRAHGPLMPARLSVTLTQLTLAPFAVLIVLVPVAAAGLTVRRAIVLAVLPLFVAAYAGYVFFFPHYTLVVAAAVVLAIVVGAEQLVALTPARLRPRVAVGVTFVLAGMAVAGLPEFAVGGPTTDDLFNTPVLGNVDAQLAGLGSPRAVVLFTYDPERNAHEEPVYNAAVAWPDDAAVVRAHDLGPAVNARLFAYYAARQPDRVAYRYDEATRHLTPLGPVTALAGGTR